MRLIDADELKNMRFSCGMYDDDYVVYAPIREVMENIDKAPTIGGWISVKERLPEEEDYKQCRDYPEGVVLWFNGFESGFGWYYKSTKEWADSNDRGITNVTHWMPFPEEPKKTE